MWPWLPWYARLFPTACKRKKRTNCTHRTCVAYKRKRVVRKNKIRNPAYKHQNYLNFLPRQTVVLKHTKRMWSRSFLRFGPSAPWIIHFLIRWSSTVCKMNAIDSLRFGGTRIRLQTSVFFLTTPQRYTTRYIFLASCQRPSVRCRCDHGGLPLALNLCGPDVDEDG